MFVNRKHSEATKAKMSISAGKRWWKAQALCAATEHPKVRDIAWAAGIYEGEGSCGMFKFSLRAQVAQNDPELLFRLQRFFGGHINSRGITKGGNKTHRWEVGGARAAGFLQTIFVFLTERRKEQVKAALKLWAGN